MLKKVFQLSFRNKGILLIFFLGFFLRVWWLDKFPIGITHDELNYLISAKSLFTTGSFPPGTAPTVMPSNMKDFTVTVAEIPSFLLALFVGFSDQSLFVGRIVGVILNSAAIVLIYFITKYFTRRKNYAFVASVVWAINPWSFLMGRTIFEVNFFVFFFLFGLVMLLYLKGPKILYSAVPFVLGFFSYVGGQISFYLFILAAIVYRYFKEKSDKKYLFSLFVIFTVVLFVYLAIVLNNQTRIARGGEIYFPNDTKLAREVDMERLRSVPNNLNKIFVNKASFYLRNITDKYLGAFDPQTLFLTGEFRAAFSYQKHGTFYPIDLIFLMLGATWLFSLNRKAWFFCLFSIMAAPLTSAISTVEYSYSQRAGLMYPFLIILVGIGISYVIFEIKNLKLRNLVSLLVVFVYLAFFLNLAHIYFFRFPVYASDGWFFQDRILARYIRHASKEDNSKIIISTFEPKIVFEEYLFYNNLYKGKEVKAINEVMAGNRFYYNNVEFVSECLDISKLPDNAIWIFDSLLKCKADEVLRITRFKDVYENYLIVNDRLCRDFDLNTYVHPQSFGNFDIEKQSLENFCRSWITKI